MVRIAQTTSHRALILNRMCRQCQYTCMLLAPKLFTHPHKCTQKHTLRRLWPSPLASAQTLSMNQTALAPNSSGTPRETAGSNSQMLHMRMARIAQTTSHHVRFLIMRVQVLSIYKHATGAKIFSCAYAAPAGYPQPRVQTSIRTSLRTEGMARTTFGHAHIH